jgi:Tfp pilus assembly protein PilE
MKRSRNQLGFAVVELLLIVVVVGLLGVAYLTYQDRKASQTSSTKQTTTPVAADQAAPEIKTTSDLTSAEQTLDSVNPDDNNSDINQLDSDLAGF